MANLLIVDDELGMRQFLTHLFQREGHVVRVAENGQVALQQLQQEATDLIISDIRMPDMSGVELLRAARELLPDVEVIMMTAFANVDTAREAFLLGAYDFVQKPFDNDLLKETVTRALEKISLVKEKETLLESELFGYVKGSFTGANQNRKGLFEAANSGTIFLDEIGEMSPAMQVKLLRVLQERKVRPVGATEETTVDTRVIAATNRDLASMVSAGTFREDLYYRISVIPIELPSLRERADDISELATHFVAKFCAPTGRDLSISDSAMQLLERYSWPGNVRELEHTIERAVALERTNSIEPERLPEKISNYNPYRVAEAMEFPEDGINLTAHLDQLEKTYVLEALRRTNGNQTNAAELLHLSVRSLRHLLDKHSIRGLTAQMRSDAAGKQ